MLGSIVVPLALAGGVAFAVTAEASPESAQTFNGRTRQQVLTTDQTELAAARKPSVAAVAVAPAFRQIVTPKAGGGLSIYSSAGALAPSQGLPAVNELGSPLVLLSVGAEDGWLQVLLPTRPNGSTGWVRATDVNTSVPQYRVELSRAAHELWVIQISDGAIVLTAPAGIGKASTPTPAGEFFVRDHFPTGSNNHPYGPFAFGLSGHSEVLMQFGTGDGRLAIHGTNQPSTIGADASNGCPHVANDVVLALIDYMPLGTPVVIS